MYANTGKGRAGSGAVGCLTMNHKAAPSHATAAQNRPRFATPGENVSIGVIDYGARPHEAIAHLNEADWCDCDKINITAENDFGRLRSVDVILLIDGKPLTELEDRNQCRAIQDTLELLRKRRIGSVVLTERAWQYAKFDAGVVCMPLSSTTDAIEGAVRAIAHVRPLIRQIDKQYLSMQRLGRTLQRRFEETDRELQLASRLQRDFLPKNLPQPDPFKFSSIFRPCSWVSGDIFDVFRLDENHWGFYLADAVGHGVAAGLLTMYIKHAIRPKRILRNGYELLSPAEVLGHLNELLTAQRLPDSQFITGWYGILNVQTKTLEYAVAGHPPPLLISSDGALRELHGEGCVLGINPVEQYSNETAKLEPGDRLILYSDGLEPTLITHRPPLPILPEFEPAASDLFQLPADSFITEMRSLLDNTPGSLAQDDDVSLLMLDYDAYRPEDEPIAGR